MKTLLIALLSISLLAVLALTGCVYNFHSSVGVGAVRDESYDIKDFTGVYVASNFRYKIVQSLDYSVVVSTHENLIPYLDVYKSGSNLFVKFKPGSYSNTDAEVTVKMPVLKAVDISGASHGSVSGFESTEDIRVNVSGASQMDIELIGGKARVNISGASQIHGYLKARDADLTVSGASRCELEGSAAATDIEVSGASNVDNRDMTLDSADVQVSGASQLVIRTDGELDLNISGASRLKYVGHPDFNKIEISGASNLENIN